MQLIASGNNSRVYRLNIWFAGGDWGTPWNRFKKLAREIGCTEKVVGAYGYRQPRGGHRVKLEGINPVRIAIYHPQRLSPSFIRKTETALERWEAH